MMMPKPTTSGAAGAPNAAQLLPEQASDNMLKMLEDVTRPGTAASMSRNQPYFEDHRRAARGRQRALAALQERFPQNTREECVLALRQCRWNVEYAAHRMLGQ